MISINPWSELPRISPYILGQDLEVLKNDQAFSNLRLDALPEPFIGSPSTAEVIFLVLNPGFDQSDVDLNMKSKLYLDAVHNNLNGSSNSSFYYFIDGLEFTGGSKWWRQRLSPLIKDGVTQATLAKRVMCIEYFPYHSIIYKHAKKIVPSQEYSFALVRQAINNGKTIIVMRSRKLWLEVVPELKNYPHLTLNSHQNVTVSPSNLGEHNYDRVLQQLLKYN